MWALLCIDVALQQQHRSAAWRGDKHGLQRHKLYRYRLAVCMYSQVPSSLFFPPVSLLCSSSSTPPASFFPSPPSRSQSEAAWHHHRAAAACCDVEVETWKMTSWHLPPMLVWLQCCYYGYIWLVWFVAMVTTAAVSLAETVDGSVDEEDCDVKLDHKKLDFYRNESVLADR